MLAEFESSKLEAGSILPRPSAVFFGEQYFCSNPSAGLRIAVAARRMQPRRPTIEVEGAITARVSGK